MASKSKTSVLIVSLVLIGVTVGVGAWLLRPSVRSPMTSDTVDGERSELLTDGPVGLTRVLSKQIRRLDPTQDGWKTEELGNTGKNVLKKLGKLLEQPESLTPEFISKHVSPGFRGTSLRPAGLTEVFQDGSFSVLRWQGDGDLNTTVDASHLLAALRDLVSPYGKPRDLRVFFKLYRVEKIENSEDSSFWTSSFYESTATTAEGSLQQNAVWRCLWSPTPSSPESVMLTRLELQDYEEVKLKLTEGRLFSDCTEAVLARDPSWPQLTQSQMALSRRMCTKLGIDLISHNGIAIGDANGDGLEDSYICRPGGIPNMLLIHQKDGSVKNQAARAGVDILDRSRSALFLDIDNDGDQDLLVGFAEAVAILKNEGELQFEKSSTITPFEGLTSLTAADFDNDSLIDIFACVYPGRSPFPYHDALNGETNRLFRNLGDGNFEDVSEKYGIGGNEKRFSFAASWEDYDNDGDLDIYVANDYGRNTLHRNDGGRFVNVAAQAGVEDIAAGMSVTWGDYNRDGWPDLYVSNMFSAAGNRVTYQRNFRDGESAGETTLFQRHARGNSLFMNRGNGTFTDVSVAAGVTMGRWSWGSQFADLNNDGLEDLLVSNGYLTSEKPDDL